MSRTSFSAGFFVVFALSCGLNRAADQEPVAWWSFDQADGNAVVDRVGKVPDTVSGWFKLEEAVTGKGIRFDGYTTFLARKASQAPALTDSFTIEAWVALQALPWNWTAIVDQGGRRLPDPPDELPPVDFSRLRPGLIGTQYGEPDLSDPQARIELTETDLDWTGGAQTWSARWRGYIRAPETGHVTISAEVDDGLRLVIADRPVIDGWALGGPRSGTVQLEKDRYYPVILTYNNNGGASFLRLLWSWDGGTRETVPGRVFWHSDKDRLLATREIVPTKATEARFEPRIFFGIDAHGRLGLKANIDGKVRECISEQALPLLEWRLVTATFDARQGLAVYLNGERVASLDVQGRLAPLAGAELLIGMSQERMGPVGSEREASARWASPMVLDGVLDEIKIYSKALTPDEVRGVCSAYGSTKPRPLTRRAMPSGPARLPDRFDAVYTRLRYAEEWEHFWRVGEYPDILVHFDQLPVRLLFWRGTSYGAAWVTENGLWMGDQSLERAGPGKSPWGCSEHMSDKQTRYSSVRLVEKNDARIVVQWRYAISDITYDIFGTDEDGWGEWADEYYVIYPDGVSTRHQILWTSHLSHEWQETIVLNQPGTRPEDNIAVDAMTLANMDGGHRTYSWRNGPPRSFADCPGANIQITNLKSKYRPFIIFEPNPRIRPFRGAIRPDYSHFPWWNHWPVALLPNDGRQAMGPDRPSHSSLSQSIEESEVIHRQDNGSYSVTTLIGMTDKPVTNLVPLARSWNNPPALSVTGGAFASEGYDKAERAYVLTKSPGELPGPLRLRIDASEQAPLVNPAFIIRHWGQSGAKLEIDGKAESPGQPFRLGKRKDLDGTALIVWIPQTFTRPVDLALLPADGQ